MAVEDRLGWSDVPALLEWKCPECKVTSNVDDWVETESWCEDCRDGHDARDCPNCSARFDSVWGAPRIELENQ